MYFYRHSDSKFYYRLNNETLTTTENPTHSHQERQCVLPMLLFGSGRRCKTVLLTTSSITRLRARRTAEAFPQECTPHHGEVISYSFGGVFLACCGFAAHVSCISFILLFWLSHKPWQKECPVRGVIQNYRRDKKLQGMFK